MTSAATSDAEGEGEAEENVGRRENWDCIWIEVCLGVMLGPVEDHEDEDEEELVMGRMMDVHGDGENVSSPAGDKMVDGVRRKGGLEDRVCIQVTGFRVLPGKYADPWTDRRGAQRKRRKRAINQRNLAVSETEDKPAAGHRSDVVCLIPHPTPSSSECPRKLCCAGVELVLGAVLYSRCGVGCATLSRMCLQTLTLVWSGGGLSSKCHGACPDGPAESPMASCHCGFALSIGPRIGVCIQVPVLPHP